MENTKIELAAIEKMRAEECMRDAARQSNINSFNKQLLDIIMALKAPKPDDSMMRKIGGVGLFLASKITNPWSINENQSRNVADSLEKYLNKTQLSFSDINDVSRILNERRSYVTENILPTASSDSKYFYDEQIRMLDKLIVHLRVITGHNNISTSSIKLK
jgi:hypothetical protein